MRYRDIPVTRGGTGFAVPVGIADIKIYDEGFTTITITTKGPSMHEFLQLGTVKALELNAFIQDVDGDKAAAWRENNDKPIPMPAAMDVSQGNVRELYEDFRKKVLHGDITVSEDISDFMNKMDEALR